MITDRGIIDNQMPFVVGLLALVVVVGGLGVWSISTEIHGAVISHGRLSPVASPNVVSHQSGGVVSEIFVREGDVVQNGDLLLRLDSETLEIELSSTTDMLTDLLARHVRLEAVRDGASRLAPIGDLPHYMSELPSLKTKLLLQEELLEDHRARLRREIELEEQQILQVMEQLAGVKVELASVDSEIEIVEADLARQIALRDRKLVPTAAVSPIERESIRFRSHRGQLVARRAELSGRLAELQLARTVMIDRKADHAQSELDRIEPDILRLLGKRRELVLELSMLEIRAPVAGTIHDLRVLGERSIAIAGSPLMTIIPINNRLRATVRVATKDIDQVYVTQRAGIRLHAYNARVLPKLDGEVEMISAEVKQDPVDKRNYYEISIKLPHIGEGLPEALEIVNGMELTAFIQTQPETPFDYVTEPITDYFRRSLRDR
jgi:HlyD family type I secretion membrane fusion protein